MIIIETTVPLSKVSLLDDPDKRFAMKTEKNMGTHKEMRRLKVYGNREYGSEGSKDYGS